MKIKAPLNLRGALFVIKVSVILYIWFISPIRVGVNMLEGKNIILGVCGSIAAYKSALLVRLLVKAGAMYRW
jgi:hypothetical protein